MPCQQRLLSFRAWFLAYTESFAMLTIAQLTCLRLRQKLARTGQPRRKFTIAITVKQGHYLAVWLTMHINLKAFLTSEQGNLRMTLKTDFGKCSLFVFFSRWKKRSKPGIFVFPPNMENRLANPVAVWRQSEVVVDFQKVLDHEVFSPERSLNQPKTTRVCIRSTKPIKSLYFR